MAIAAVDGYGDITSSNAKEIYTAYMKGDIDLSASQRVYCEHFLTAEEIEEIEYDVDVQKNSGSSQINTDGADENANAASAAGQTAATGAALGGTIAAVCGGMTKLKAGGSVNGFCSLACSIVAVAGAAVALGLSYIFDTSLSDRNARNDESDTTNETIDSYTEALEATMESMNDDMETYQEQSETLTVTMNQKASEMAVLQIQLADATAAGDTAGIQSIKEQMQSLEEMDTSEMEDGLGETQENLEAYQAANNESIGVSDAGATVAEFLKDGTGMGVLATTNAIMATAAAAIIGIAAAIGAIPKLWSPAGPIDGAPATASTIMWYAAMALMATTATKMSSTASDEFECGSSGGNMQDHVDTLNGMIEEQLAYTEETGESFAETDEESAESQAEAQEAANKAVAANTSSGTDKDKDKDKDEDGAIV